jgi:hypothetical protein
MKRTAAPRECCGGSTKSWNVSGLYFSVSGIRFIMLS